MFWWHLAFMAIAGYAVLTIGIEQMPPHVESEHEKARQPSGARPSFGLELLEAQPGFEPGYEAFATLPRRHSATGPMQIFCTRLFPKAKAHFDFG